MLQSQSQARGHLSGPLIPHLRTSMVPPARPSHGGHSKGPVESADPALRGLSSDPPPKASALLPVHQTHVKGTQSAQQWGREAQPAPHPRLRSAPSDGYTSAHGLLPGPSCFQELQNLGCWGLGTMRVFVKSAHPRTCLPFRGHPGKRSWLNQCTDAHGGSEIPTPGHGLRLPAAASGRTESSFSDWLISISAHGAL